MEDLKTPALANAYRPVVEGSKMDKGLGSESIMAAAPMFRMFRFQDPRPKEHSVEPLHCLNTCRIVRVAL